MSLFKFILVSVFFVDVLNIVAQRVCTGPNEELKACGACDGTCTNPNPFCSEECEPASCGCIEGTIRNDSNICIPVKECCPEPNEELKFCGACDGTCDIPSPICSDLCRPASCGCIEGTVRNDYNICIPVKQCCPKPNEELKPCGACDGTCTNPNPICTLECGPASCGCIEGTVRNDYNICITVEECCPEPNEELKFCGACDGTCTNPNPICPFICKSSSCGCIKGTVRNKYNKCIPVEECCPEPNEELKLCGACDGTCDIPNPICTEECGPASCGCVNGTVRNKCNKCIPLKDCCY